MEGNGKIGKQPERSFYWLGILAVLPFVAGCGSILPWTGQRASISSAKSAAPEADHHVATPNQQIVSASHHEDTPTVAQSRFDLARFKAENAGVVTIAGKAGEKEALPGEKLQGSERMTFDQAVSATLTADPKIRAGLELITQAKADLLTSSLFPNPTLTADGIFLPLRAFTPDRPGGPPQMDVLVGYPIDWFVFGKRAAAMASARHGVRQSESNYADLIRQRVASAAGAFYDVVEAKALLVLARQDTENLTKLATATKKAFEAGGRPPVEVNRVRLDLLKSEQALREAEAALVITKAKLRSLLGRRDSDPDFDVAGDLDAPLTAEPMPVEKAYALAQENRPDIQSLRWQVSKAEADIIVERRKAFPQITPQAGFSRQFQAQSLGVPDADSMTVSVTTTVPLFDRNQGNRMKAMSIAAQNSFNLESGLVDLRAEVTQVVQDFVTAYKKTQAVAQDQKKVAQDVLDSITKAYDVGGRPLIDVLDAQRSYRETHRLYINSRADYWRSVYRFSSVIGKQITQP